MLKAFACMPPGCQCHCQQQITPCHVASPEAVLGTTPPTGTAVTSHCGQPHSDASTNNLHQPCCHATSLQRQGPLPLMPSRQQCGDQSTTQQQLTARAHTVCTAVRLNIGLDAAAGSCKAAFTAGLPPQSQAWGSCWQTPPHENGCLPPWGCLQAEHNTA